MTKISREFPSSCVYRFEAQKDEKVKLTLTNVIIKNRNCETRVSRDTGRLMCDGNTTAAIRIFEIPWLEVPGVPRDCLCSVDKDKFMPFTYVSTTNVIELRFDVTGMNATDDFTTLFFEGTWKFIRTPTCGRDYRMKGPNGEVSFSYPSETPDQVRLKNCCRFVYFS